MKTFHMIYLASASTSRQMLLREAGIPFVAVGHTADEDQCDVGLSLEETVSTIALLKMEHAVLPQGSEGLEIYVLSADTLTADHAGTMYGKPADHADALKTIQALREGARVATAFCLDKKRFEHDSWKTIKRISRTVSAECICDLPDAWLERYLQQTPALSVAGSLVVDGFGTLFIKKIIGSYSAVVGLPMSELRESLDDLGFFEPLR